MKNQAENKISSTILALVLFAALLVPVKGFEYFIDVKNSAGNSDYMMGSRLVTNASYYSTALDVNMLLSEYSRLYLNLDQTNVVPQSEYSTRSAELGYALRYISIPNNQIFATAYGFVNRYEDVYSYYNSSGFGLHAKWKHYFQPGQLFSLTYDLLSKSFSEVAEASFTEHEFQLAYNHSFPSRTSLNIQNSISLQEFLPQSTITTYGRRVVVTESESIGTNFLNRLDLRIGQSLGTRLGLTVWLGNQFLLNERQDSLSLQDGMDNPFIDRYRWTGNSIAERIIFRLNPNNRITFSHSFSTRSFVNVPVYDFDFYLMDYVLINDELVSLGFDRSDSRNTINFEWVVSRHFDQLTWLSTIEMGLNVGYLANSSNDPLYDYDGMNYSISLNIYN